MGSISASLIGRFKGQAGPSLPVKLVKNHNPAVSCSCSRIQTRRQTSAKASTMQHQRLHKSRVAHSRTKSVALHLELSLTRTSHRPHHPGSDAVDLILDPPENREEIPLDRATGGGNLLLPKQDKVVAIIASFSPPPTYVPPHPPALLQKLKYRAE